jgi:hypothetical protein
LGGRKLGKHDFTTADALVDRPADARARARPVWGRFPGAGHPSDLEAVLQAAPDPTPSGSSSSCCSSLSGGAAPAVRSHRRCWQSERQRGLERLGQRRLARTASRSWAMS